MLLLIYAIVFQYLLRFDKILSLKYYYIEFLDLISEKTSITL